jgi:hypothetical protein
LGDLIALRDRYDLAQRPIYARPDQDKHGTLRKLVKINLS